MRTVVGLRTRLPIGLLAGMALVAFGRIGACTPPGNSRSRPPWGRLAQLGRSWARYNAFSSRRTSSGTAALAVSTSFGSTSTTSARRQAEPHDVQDVPDPAPGLPDSGHQRPRFAGPSVRVRHLRDQRHIPYAAVGPVGRFRGRWLLQRQHRLRGEPPPVSSSRYSRMSCASSRSVAMATARTRPSFHAACWPSSHRQRHRARPRQPAGREGFTPTTKTTWSCGR